jgi:hypothetical protein
LAEALLLLVVLFYQVEGNYYATSEEFIFVVEVFVFVLIGTEGPFFFEAEGLDKRFC